MAAEVVTQLVTNRTIELVTEQPFYIPMTGPAARPRRSLKHDDTFIVLDSHGDIGASAGGPDGLFNADTRYLARLEMVLDEMQPLLLGSNLRDDNSALTVDLTNSRRLSQRPSRPAKGHAAHRALDLPVARHRLPAHRLAEPRRPAGEFRSHAAVRQRFCRPVRGPRRAPSAPRCRLGQARSARPTSYSNIAGWTGSRASPRCISIRGRRGSPSTPRPIISNWRRSRSLRCSSPISCNRPIMHKPVPFFRGLLAHRREMRRFTAGATSIETSNDIFNEVLCQAMADLNMLMTETPQGRYPYAGIPWYSTTFGRDGLITALQMLWIDPRIAQGVLKRLAFFQAKAVDPLNDAEPGKILHEMRGGEMAALREVPFAQYYGSVDSTPLFVLLAGLYVERTGDEETLAELWPAIEAALQWIDGPGDPDRDGFVEYQRATEQGLANQGWKDSYDAIFHADGKLAEGYIALAEVQGYVFAGKRLAARCARRLGMIDKAASPRIRGAAAGRTVRGGVLVRGTRHLRARAGWRQSAVPGAHLQRGAAAVHRHRARGSREAGGCRSDEPEVLFGLGHSHRGARRGPLQPDVLSRRLDLAARQCADRARLCPLRAEAFGRASVQGSVRRRELYGFAAVAGTVLRIPARASAWAGALSRRLRAAGLGQRHPVHAAGGRARARIRRRTRRDPTARSPIAGIS